MKSRKNKNFEINFCDGKMPVTDWLVLVSNVKIPTLPVVAPVKAITTVAGNVDLYQATQNALYTVELCNKNIPVYKGSSGPLKRKLETSKFFHGKDGLGDTGPYIPKLKAQKENAINKIVSIINSNPNEIEIIAIGPLTNIAKVFKEDPSTINKFLIFVFDTLNI